jgi:hypothetical protein
VDPTPAKRHGPFAEAVLHVPRHLPHDAVGIDKWWRGVVCEREEVVKDGRSVDVM